jgi:hypothetical protein
VLAVVLDDSTRREEAKKTPHRFAHDRRLGEALIPASSHHEHFARAFRLLHAQPRFGAPDCLRRRRERRSKIQRAGSSEAQLIERLLQ